ncbi:MAG: DEAD/DEAH box helicase, partial [Myxococcales bacterium]|nr:DEAD/DEAH box helicase [Myxococcales bacterium]
MADAADDGAPGFASLALPPGWVENLTQLGYHTMTPIQARALPPMLAGRDVLGHAGTGTGKTAAFGLALLARITPNRRRPGALVLCPTRELATQVADELRRLARPLPNTKIVTLIGGTSIGRDVGTLGHGADVVVGTPGRVHDHLARGRLDLDEVRTLVLDEADRMLELGFVDAVTTIARAVPPDRQTLLFSATFADDVRALATSLQRDPVDVEVAAAADAVAVTEVVYALDGADRVAALVRILGHHAPASAVVFCNQRERCDEVATALRDAGHAVAAMHGGLDQADRETLLLLFGNGSLRVLVATDVAARGLDIADLAAVVNFELPRDPAVYVHRIGRTARAGRRGLAISLVGRGDRRLLDALDRDLAAVDVATVPAPAAPPPPPA